MTPETREALKEFAQGVKLLGKMIVPCGNDDLRIVLDRADRLIRALEQEEIYRQEFGPDGPHPVQPPQALVADLADSVRFLIPMAQGWANLHPVGSNREIVAQARSVLERAERDVTIERFAQDNMARMLALNERTVAAIATDYETWRDEQLDTLRKLYNARGPGKPYLSFPEFCFKQWDGSDKGKVKVSAQPTK